MPASEFVAALRRAARAMAAARLDELAVAEDGRGPDAVLARWYRGLTDAERAAALRALGRFTEAGVFLTLAVIDGVLRLPDEPGSFELFRVRDGQRERLANFIFGT